MPRKHQKIRNSAGFTARRVRTKTGKRVTRWMRTSTAKSTINPLAGPSIGPLPPRAVSAATATLAYPPIAPPSVLERAEALAAASSRAQDAIDTAVADGDLPEGKTLDDVVRAELRRLAAEEIRQMRRADMLLENAGVVDVHVTAAFARDVQRGGLDWALARVSHSSAFAWQTDRKLREADVRNSFTEIPLLPRVDENGQVLLLAEDYVPTREQRCIELWLEAADMAVPPGNPEAIRAFAEAWIAEEGLYD